MVVVTVVQVSILSGWSGSATSVKSTTTQEVVEFVESVDLPGAIKVPSDWHSGGAAVSRSTPPIPYGNPGAFSITKTPPDSDVVVQVSAGGAYSTYSPNLQVFRVTLVQVSIFVKQSHFAERSYHPHGFVGDHGSASGPSLAGSGNG